MRWPRCANGALSSDSGGGIAPSAGQPPATGTFAALHYPGYRRLLLGTTLANAGQWLQQVTISWLAYDITGSGATLGIVNLARAAATVGFAPASGLAVDRVPPRRLIIIVNTWLALVSAALGLVILLTGTEVAYLVAFAFLSGLGAAVDQPLRQAAVFMLVPRSVAPNAVALMQTGWGVMRSVGPAIGGLLIWWAGPGGNFLLQAGLYLLILANGLTIAFPVRPRSGMGAPFLDNLTGGVRYLRHDGRARAFLFMGWVLPLLIIPVFTALPPIYAKEVYHGGPLTLGLLLSSVGVGAIFGGFVAASLERVDRRGLVQLGALFCLSLSLIAFAAVRTLALAMPLLALAGFFELLYLTSNQTLLQMSIPDSVRGRVTSIVSLNAGLSPLGALYAGLASDFVGPAWTTIALCTVAAAISLLVFLFSTSVRDYRLSEVLREVA